MKSFIDNYIRKNSEHIQLIDSVTRLPIKEYTENQFFVMLEQGEILKTSIVSSDNQYYKFVPKIEPEELIHIIYKELIDAKEKGAGSGAIDRMLNIFKDNNYA